MVKWLVIGAAVALGWASVAAGAAMKGLTPAEVAGVAKVRAVDLRIAEETPVPHSSPFTGGMLVSHDLAPNATIGVGFPGIYGRRKNGKDVRINGGPRHSRNPAVTFALKF